MTEKVTLADFENVKEQYPLYDTVGISAQPSVTGKDNPDGWFTSYSQMAGSNDIPFFNVRNKSAGLYWCNQDKRDQLAWPFIIQSIGVRFHASTNTRAPGWATDTTFSPEDAAAAIFVNDLPRHTSLKLQIQQDERLKTHVFMCQPGYGVSGSGYARGSISAWNVAASNMYDHHLSIQNAGTPQIDNRFLFPIPLLVPRTANLNVRLEVNEYGRALLGALPFQGVPMATTDSGDDIHMMSAFSSIQVTLFGKRLVQQRGAYHR